MGAPLRTRADYDVATCAIAVQFARGQDIPARRPGESDSGMIFVSNQRRQRCFCQTDAADAWSVQSPDGSGARPGMRVEPDDDNIDDCSRAARAPAIWLRHPSGRRRRPDHRRMHGRRRLRARSRKRARRLEMDLPSRSVRRRVRLGTERNGIDRRWPPSASEFGGPRAHRARGRELSVALGSGNAETPSDETCALGNLDVRGEDHDVDQRAPGLCTDYRSD